ncbi:glycosyltransferase family 2 protein [Adhaeribacter aquaticus]|uniref:glycosyltransferase family 2 protein n=1 Tax=Adhaeribacter aquaticus TaxID=299567 RepID=UPI0003F9E893|nr:glycosyltransferase family 2 protein [Adhaeribacter aquaticus]
MQLLTAIILTKNEEANIAEAIKSVSWANEIIIVDSFSTDATLAIAKQFPVKILQRTFDTHARQKNWAIQQASYSWIFILDADERVPESLKIEVQNVLKISLPAETAFWIGRQNYFMGQLVRYSGWQHDRVIRLFRKDSCWYKEVQVHEEIETSGVVGHLTHKLVHYTYHGLRQYLEKWDYYTWLSAQDRGKKTEKVTVYHLGIKPLIRFFRHYIWFRGFLDGKVGFVISYMAAISVFMRYLKLWRIQEGEK